MKTSSPLVVSLLVGSLAVLGMAGCSTFNKSAAPDATRPVGGKAINLLQFRDDVQASRTAIIRTGDALGRLPTASNAQDAYASFSTELTALSQLIDKTSRESADVRNSGKELFAQWEAETQSIKNPDIRAVAEARRTKLQAAYASMLPPLIDARAHFSPLVSNLTDLRKALALDLTPAGIQALNPLIAKAGKEGTATVKSLEALSTELDKIVAALPPPTVAPASR